MSHWTETELRFSTSSRRAGQEGAASLSRDVLGRISPRLFVSLGISQGSENNPSLASRDLGGGCQVYFKFFEISKPLKKSSWWVGV